MPPNFSSLSTAALIAAYDPALPLAHASTIPAPWYTDARLADLERRTVFSRSWQVVARTGQLERAGDYVTAEVAGAPVVVVRGNDGTLRGFFNVCRHHAAAVMSAPHGNAQHLVCPYHGWTYNLEGALESTPQFGGVCGFDPRDNGLVPLEIATWEHWVFARLEPACPSLDEFIGAALHEKVGALDVCALRFHERRRYIVDCNWKVFVDNYLDGGYHVPHIHVGLDSVLAPGRYTIENGERFCAQSSAIRTRDAGDPDAAATTAATAATMADVRQGDSAHYFWLYPNFMINWYEGVMDTNLVVPLGVDRTEVIFDYWFADTSDSARERNGASIAVSERIQDEDAAICRSVQRGLNSRSYSVGRISVRREAGEHLFHRLLHADLSGPAA